MNFKDEDAGIIHYMPDSSDVCLCGLMRGWTRRDTEPVKEKYGITCEDCIDEIREIKKLKSK